MWFKAATWSLDPGSAVAFDCCISGLFWQARFHFISFGLGSGLVKQLEIKPLLCMTKTNSALRRRVSVPPITDLFFQCSVSCGQGTTTRQVLCVNYNDQEVNASECDPDDRPSTEQDCAMSQCPSRSGESLNTSTRNKLPRAQSHLWRTGPWGAVRHPSRTFTVFISV